MATNVTLRHFDGLVPLLQTVTCALCQFDHIIAWECPTELFVLLGVPNEPAIVAFLSHKYYISLFETQLIVTRGLVVELHPVSEIVNIISSITKLMNRWAVVARRGGGGCVTEGGQTFKIKNRLSHHKIVSSKQFW